LQDDSYALTGFIKFISPLPQLKYVMYLRTEKDLKILLVFERAYLASRTF
jgi:hypothetical protein